MHESAALPLTLDWFFPQPTSVLAQAVPLCSSDGPAASVGVPFTIEIRVTNIGKGALG
jgi:hypothetical protein